MPTDPPETRVAVMESRLDNHEKVCSERYEAIAESIKDLAGTQSKTLWAALFAAFTVLGYVLANWVPQLRVPD